MENRIIKVNIWHIEGYTGNSDYDGPSDCNHHEDIAFDARYTKKGVISMWYATHNFGRETVVHSCECIGEYEIHIDENGVSTKWNK